MVSRAEVQHVVVTEPASPIGAAIVENYRRLGAKVSGVELTADPELAGLDSEPIDLVIIADGFAGEPRHATDLTRKDFAAGFTALTFAPFHLAGLLKPRLMGEGGAKLVLLTRSTAAMTAKSEGNYLERPFRAAAHQLWKTLSVEWREAGIAAGVIAVDAVTEVPRLIETIEQLSVPADGCVLLDSSGKQLGW